MPYPKQNHHKGPLIYLLRFPNGKCYVGQTITTFEKRLIKHKSSSKNNEKGGCVALNAAIRANGWNNIHKEILIYCDADQLDIYEKKFIKFYSSISPNGYNLMEGGNSNKQMSDATIIKMKETRLRKSVVKDNKNVSYGCIIRYQDHSGEIVFAILDHPLCSFKIYKSMYDAVESVRELNTQGSLLGINCSEYDTADNKINTFRDVKSSLYSIIEVIQKENLRSDREKRMLLHQHK